MKQLIPNFILSNLDQGLEQDSFKAYTMFIDLSGFTPLTEKLMEKGTEGAEELSFVLNNIFSPLVKIVYQKGGFIPYFAGDAFIAIFPIDAINFKTHSFLSTAYFLKEEFNRKESIEAKLGTIDIGIKIGLSIGEVEWGIVGNENHKTYYFKGEAIEGAVHAQMKAKDQQIVFDQLLFATLENQYHLLKVDQQHYLLDQSFEKLSNNTIPTRQSEDLNPLVTKFLPDVILDSEIKGEFRNVISVFISFKGLQKHKELNDFAKIVLEEIDNFSGYFKEIDFSDKGGLMVAFFGAPTSFENNEKRALEFIVELRQKIQELPFKKLQTKIGLTSGVAYTGIVGGAEMSQYAVVGNQVNLAARLMSKADWETVLVDEVMTRTKNFKFEDKGQIQFKGIKLPITTYQLIGKEASEQKDYYGNMVGRENEMKSLLHFVNPIFENQFAGIIHLYGEAGIGKSRLMHEMVLEMKPKGSFSKFICKADQILKKPLNPFVYFLRKYFDQQAELSEEELKVRFERKLNKTYLHAAGLKQNETAQEFKNELIRLKSVYGALIGIDYPNSLWSQLDAKGKSENTNQALTVLFRLESVFNPVMIILEDVHWYDESSIDYLNDVLKRFQNVPVVVVVLGRYLDDGTKPVLFNHDLIETNKIKELEIDLSLLSKTALQRFLEDRLGGAVHIDFLELMYRSTNGNPFYLEQTLQYFNESNLIAKEDGKWNMLDKNIKMSNSIRSILIARIDRLSSILKETVKAAAVIGTEFEVPVLTEVMKSNQEYLKEKNEASLVLKDQIKTAEKGQIWQAVNELRYIFKHSLMRETVYDMQLHGQLREAHVLIANAIENLYPNQLEKKYVDLAYHYEQSENVEKTKEYYKKAADYSRSNFQNQLALRYYNKLIGVLVNESKKSEELARALIRKGELLEQNGNWEDAQKVYGQALEIASEVNDKLLSGRTNNALGHLNLLKGNYDQARNYFEVAVTWFEELNDETGVAKVFGNLGNLYLRQGKYPKAIDYFERSINMSNQNGEKVNANIVASLGLAHMNLGNFNEGIQRQEYHLDIAEQHGDKLGMATLYTNTGIVYFEKGDFDAAKKCYEKGLELSEELGNKFLMSIAIGSLGTVNQERGEFDAAMKCFKKDLQLVEEMGDKQGIAIVNGLLGDLLNVQGQFDDATIHLEIGLQLSKEIGYQKGTAKATNSLADVFVNQKQYKEAIELYNQAIEISEKIGNKSVLAHCLIEKANAELNSQQLSAAKSTYDQCSQLVKELGNPGLVFQQFICQSRIERGEGQYDKAKKTLFELNKTYNAEKEQAAIFFELQKLPIPDKEVYRTKSLQSFEKLYAETPQFKYKITINELKNT